MWVRVCAGRQAAGAGWSGPGVGDGSGSWSCAGSLEERAVRLPTGTAQGGVEVTVLTAERRRRRLERRGGGGRGEGGGQVAFGQPLGVCDGRGGRGDGGGRQVPQGPVLFDHAAILARPVGSLGNVRSLLLRLRWFARCILHCDVFLSVCCRGVSTAGCCQRVLAVADWCAGV